MFLFQICIRGGHLVERGVKTTHFWREKQFQTTIFGAEIGKIGVLVSKSTFKTSIFDAEGPEILETMVLTQKATFLVKNGTI